MLLFQELNPFLALKVDFMNFTRRINQKLLMIHTMQIRNL